MSLCPLIEIKASCGVAGLPEGCPLRAAQCSIMKPPPERGTFTDPRDGRTYRTVKIGEQVWMAENLNFDYKGSKCYDDDPKNADKYGRLYDWETAKKACPPGWHLPSIEEWQTLVDFADGDETAGKKLKTTSGWNDYEGTSGNGTDEFGFSALPGGFGYSDGSFRNAGYNGNWWSSSEYSSRGAYSRGMGYSSEGAFWYYDYKSNLLSVRCLQDCNGECGK